MRTGIVELFVEDQARALRFHTGVVGLRLETDAADGEGGRCDGGGGDGTTS